MFTSGLYIYEKSIKSLKAEFELISTPLQAPQLAEEVISFSREDFLAASFVPKT